MSVAVEFELFTSSFCGACRQTRAVLDQAARVLADAAVVERAVESEPERAEAQHIEATPTVIVRGPDGAEVFRASGVPNIHQVLVAAVRALEKQEH